MSCRFAFAARPSRVRSKSFAFALTAVLAVVAAEPLSAQQNPLKPEEQAAQMINAANKAYTDKQFPVAIDRYREYLKTHANQMRHW